jgi:hypothetical protein
LSASEHASELIQAFFIQAFFIQAFFIQAFLLMLVVGLVAGLVPDLVGGLALFTSSLPYVGGRLVIAWGSLGFLERFKVCRPVRSGFDLE